MRGGGRRVSVTVRELAPAFGPAGPRAAEGDALLRAFRRRVAAAAAAAAAAASDAGPAGPADTQRRPGDSDLACVE
jgi:hypothetical protein